MQYKFKYLKRLLTKLFRDGLLDGLFKYSSNQKILIMIMYLNLFFNTKV